MKSSIGKGTVLFLLLLHGCYCRHLYVQQEWVDRNFLASTRIGTPDPRQDHPPEGQRLLIGWDFPRSIYTKGLVLEVAVRFWNEREEVQCLPLPRKRGATALFFPDEKILTYRVRVLDQDGEVIETWKHHFWTEWIEIGCSS